MLPVRPRSPAFSRLCTHQETTGVDLNEHSPRRENSRRRDSVRRGRAVSAPHTEAQRVGPVTIASAGRIHGWFSILPRFFQYRRALAITRRIRGLCIVSLSVAPSKYARHRRIESVDGKRRMV